MGQPPQGGPPGGLQQPVVMNRRDPRRQPKQVWFYDLFYFSELNFVLKSGLISESIFSHCAFGLDFQLNFHQNFFLKPDKNWAILTHPAC